MILSKVKPEFFAFFTAIANGTIGPFNRFGFAEGATHHQIAFFKCFGAFLIVLGICLVSPVMRTQLFALRDRIWAFALLGFLGVFCLYFFKKRVQDQPTLACDPMGGLVRVNCGQYPHL